MSWHPTEREANKSLSGGWSATGDLVTLAPSTVKAVSLQCNFPTAEDYTVEFNLTKPNNLSNDVIIRAQALITWSVEGNSVSRRVNVGNGVSVTGVGQACKIVIIDDSRLQNGHAAVTYNVSVQVAPGSRAATQQPPTFVPHAPTLTIVAVANNFDFVIPQDAGVISVSVQAASIDGSPIPDQGVIVKHLQGAITMKQYDFRDGLWVAVAAGATIVNISNNLTVAALVQVTYGIDG